MTEANRITSTGWTCRRKMTINVTQKHIDAGSRNRCFSCPVAMAIKEATGEEWAVDGRAAFRTALGAEGVCQLPPEAKRFVLLIDHLGHVEPFSFELDLP